MQNKNKNKNKKKILNNEQNVVGPLVETEYKQHSF